MDVYVEINLLNQLVERSSYTHYTCYTALGSGISNGPMPPIQVCHQRQEQPQPYRWEGAGDPEDMRQSTGQETRGSLLAAGRPA